MTTYTLPTSAPIGTPLYFNGDIVWFNGAEWVPVVMGTVKLNNLGNEVIADEAKEQTDIATVESMISGLQAEVYALQTEVSELSSRIDHLENSGLDSRVSDLENDIFSVTSRLDSIS
jgi:uncharacterized protein YceH (UPF0502 family)